MKDTRRVKSGIAVTLLATIFLGSCSIGLSPDTSGPEEDLAELDQALSITANSAVATAEAQLQASDGVGASTTYNFDSSVDPVSVAAGETETLETRVDFPYPGWSTNGTVEHISDVDGYGSNAGWNETGYDWKSVLGGNNLFKVTAVTAPDETGVYPEESVREVYYVASADGTYDSTDYIFDPLGWAKSGHRDEYIARYSDGSTRNHWVMVPENSNTYTAFDVNAALNYPTASENAITVDADAVYSSTVLYTHDLERTFNYWFWNDNDAVDPMVIGVRYYTEHFDGTEYVGSSLTFEYTYNGDPDRDGSTPAILARTVIREEMRFSHDDRNEDGAFQSGETGSALRHTLRMRTEINNTSGGADLIYLRNGKQISDWRNRNAQDAKVRGVQRQTLPDNYRNVAEDFEAALTDFD